MNLKQGVWRAESRRRIIREIPDFMSLCGPGSPQTLTQAHMLLPDELKSSSSSILKTSVKLHVAYGEEND